jgi:hypothetical protein
VAKKHEQCNDGENHIYADGILSFICHDEKHGCKNNKVHMWIKICLPKLLNYGWQSLALFALRK